jgi:type I restriction enzyme M protein
MNHSQITSFLWGTADLIRDSFKRGKYQDVILLLTVLRRLDCVLEPAKDRVLETHAKYGRELENPDQLLRKTSGFAFYNTSRYTFSSLLADAPNLARNLRHYIQGFSPNMREVLEQFDFDNTITKLDDAGLLFQVVERFGEVDLHPDVVPNPMMGTIFEELIRKFNEALNENPGEHFTLRDVVRLMASLLIAGDEERLSEPGRVVTVYDPSCGTGGMLTITKDFIQGSPEVEGVNPQADVVVFGQEVNPETFAVCKSDLFLKSETGRAGDRGWGPSPPPPPTCRHRAPVQSLRPDHLGHRGRADSAPPRRGFGGTPGARDDPRGGRGCGARGCPTTGRSPGSRGR